MPRSISGRTLKQKDYITNHSPEAKSGILKFNKRLFYKTRSILMIIKKINKRR